jgi:hypothetical protein
MPEPDPIVSDLDQELEKTLSLFRAQTVLEWIDPEKERAYLPLPCVRLAHHFDVQAEFLIRDSAVGTLGIVNRVAPGSNKDVQAQVCRYVDAATYARHLLLRDPDRRTAPALTVELVLLTAEAPDVTEAIGDALRSLLQTTDSLFHVGINLLVHRGNEKFAGSLRRGLPWLLVATRKWLASDRSKPTPVGATPTTAAADRVQAIQLSNYRLPGTREFRLDASARVHLVHGPNGSGKSSLVEALELVSCGSVERIEQAKETDYETDYARIIQNRDMGAAAKIEVRWRARPAQSWQVVAKGLDTPPAVPVHSSSFRLDQPLMDRLVGTSAHERAGHYLRAFFPEAGAALQASATAGASRAEAVQKLRPGIERLRKAQQALKAVEGWRGGARRQTGEAFPDVLNRWLERTALSDLAQRGYAVRATLETARSAGWAAAHEPEKGVLAPAPGVTVADVQDQLQRWTAEASELEQKLASFRPVALADQSAGGAAHAITQEQCGALNQVTSWLFEPNAVSGQGLFGDKLVKVLSGTDPPTYGTAVIIGAEGWATPVVGALDAMLAASDLPRDKPAAPWPGKVPWADYEAAVTHHTAFLTAGATLSTGFLELLGKGSTEDEFDGSLIAAVNELMALFTPARWAYHDIRLPSQLTEGQVQVGMELGPAGSKMRAELHLNTAELNLFTIALFLLCAGRVPKPLGLLVMDDPLQNMDELTSTALARGLAKVIRSGEGLGRSEEFLLLFHGYEDIQRFQDEMSGATYRLPWLSPGRSSEPPIQADGVSARGREVQSLKGLVEARESRS